MIVDLHVLSDIAVDVSVSREGDPCGYPLVLVWLVGLPCGSESWCGIFSNPSWYICRSMKGQRSRAMRVVCEGMFED